LSDSLPACLAGWPAGWLSASIISQPLNFGIGFVSRPEDLGCYAVLGILWGVQSEANQVVV